MCLSGEIQSPKVRGPPVWISLAPLLAQLDRLPCQPPGSNLRRRLRDSSRENVVTSCCNLTISGVPIRYNNNRNRNSLTSLSVSVLLTCVVCKHTSKNIGLRNQNKRSRREKIQIHIFCRILESFFLDFFLLYRNIDKKML